MFEDNGRYAGKLTTNGFELALPDKVQVIVRPMQDNASVKGERERLDGFWFLHWFDGKLYHFRTNAGGPNIEGDQTSLRTVDHPWLLRAMVEEALISSFDSYEPFRVRPFSFLAQKRELVSEAAKEARINPSELSGISVVPRYELSGKIYEPSENDIRIGIFATIRMRYDIDTGLSDLAARGMRLSGLQVVRRQPSEGQSRHLGSIKEISGPTLHLEEARNEETVPIGSAKLEGSKESFAFCLESILGSRKRSFDLALEKVESGFRLGPDLDRELERIGQFLSRKPLVLGNGVEATVGSRIELSNNGVTTQVYAAPPVDYVFDRSGASRSRQAWDGLAQYGPYDRTSFSRRNPRILVVFPKSTQGKVEAFLAAFRDGMGTSSRAYETGFTKVMGLVAAEFEMCPVDLGGVPNAQVADKYRSAIERKLEDGINTHAAFVFLQNEHANLRGLQSPYIQTKSMLMTLGIASQEVRMSTVNQNSYSLGYTLRNIAVSLYAKMNGTPWTVHQDQKIADELVVGIGFAELSGSRVEERQRHVGITTVFSGDGTYVLGNVSKECAYNEYPGVVRETLLGVLRDVKKRNNWQPGETIRIVFHAHRPLKRVDVAQIVFDCAREVGSEQDVQLAFVTVTHDHPFLLLDKAVQGAPIKRGSSVKKGVWAPARGTIARVGRNTRLLAVNSGTLIKRPLTPLPEPLLISVHRDSTFNDIDYLAEQVLKFTCLSWRSVLPTATPVTISYSSRIAELLARLREVPDWSAVALNVKLKYSRWFL